MDIKQRSLSLTETVYFSKKLIVLLFLNGNKDKVDVGLH